MGGLRYRDYEDLVIGTPEERLLRGYVACIAPMVIQILRVIPNNERLELVFEEQREYQHYANMAFQISILDTACRQQPWAVTSDGKPKLAKWSFVPKGSTVMTDPADYFVFALRQSYVYPKSKKAQWCKPILQSGKGEGIGVIMKRDMIRNIITSTQTIAYHKTLAQWLSRGGP